MGAKTVIGIEIGFSKTRVVAYDHSVNAVSECSAFNTSAQEDISSCIQSCAINAAKGAIQVISYPGSSAVLRSIIIPAEIKDINEYIEWELSSYISGSLQDYVYDHHTLPVIKPRNYKRSMVVATPKSEISGLIRCSQSFGFSPEIIDIDFFATINALEVMKREVHAHARSVIIKAEEDSISIIWSRNFLLEKLDVLKISNFADDEHILDEVGVRVQNACFAYDSDALFFDVNSGVDSISENSEIFYFVCGSRSNDFDFINLCSTKLGQDCKVLNPFNHLEIASTAQKEEIYGECATALGLALRTSGGKKK